MKPSLDGVDLKLGRAKKHLAFLDAERAKLLKVNGERVIGQLDPETGDYVLRVDGKPPPAEWGVDVSAFAHLLRTALDNMLWQLILVRGGTPVPKVTQFPINEDIADFNGKPKRRGPWATEADRLTDGILPKDRAFIEDAQPFKAGGDPKWHPLAMLADLNNIDKHRVVHTAYAAAAALHAQGAQGTHTFSDGLTVIVGKSGQQVELVPILWGSGRIDPALMIGHLPMFRYSGGGGMICPVNMGPRCDDPTEIAHVPASDVPDTEVCVYPAPVLEISFSDRERPMTIFDLRDIFARVQEIVEHFRPAFV